MLESGSVRQMISDKHLDVEMFVWTRFGAYIGIPDEESQPKPAGDTDMNHNL